MTAADQARLLSLLAGLPGVVEGTAWGEPCLRVGKRFLGRLREPGVFALGIAMPDKEMLIEMAPDIYFDIDHTRGHPFVLIHLAAIGDEELRHRLRSAWERLMPKRALAAWRAGQECPGGEG